MSEEAITTTETTAAIPNLGGVISPEDVSKKGSGSYSAEYVNWAKVSQLLREHAPGWQFHLEPSPSGELVWQAPNQTGFVVGYFTSPTGDRTADFYQSVMDHRNNPVPYAKISARDFTDTHRRALAAAACFTFGLAYELWAKIPVEDPHQRQPEPAPQPPKTQAPNTISQAQLSRLYAIAKENGIAPEQAKEVIHGFGFESSKDITPDKYEAVIAALTV